MDKILMDHDDVYVSATIVYAGLDGDEGAYVDAERTTKFKPLELLEAYKKGAVICVGTEENTIEYFTPSKVLCDNPNDPYACYCYICYIANDAANDYALTNFSLYAEENNG